MAWTTEQQQAIDVRNKQLLVSAAAGSGKTAVMVERVCQRIIQDGLDVRQLLVVTFTNAAASEMREKIRNAMKERARKEPGLRKQLELLPQAQISTFHVFCLDVIRRFFYLTDQEANVSVADEARARILFMEALEEIFEEAYESEDEMFHLLIDWYGTEKSDQPVRDALSSLYSTLRAFPHPERLMKANLEMLDEPENVNVSPYFQMMLTYCRSDISYAKQMMMHACNLLGQAEVPNLLEKCEEDYSAITSMVDALNSGDLMLFIELVHNVKWVTMRAKKDEKDEYELIKEDVNFYRDRAKDTIKGLRENLLSDTPEEYVKEIAATKPLAEAAFKYIHLIDQRYAEKKRSQRLIDFNDIEQYCLEILEHKEARDYYRNRFAEIFIDEYQDTNLIQEAIIKRIARLDNVFMVGDRKQCIYQFRLAEPSIFRDKYRSFEKKMQEPGATCEKIDLNKNFRSKPVILEEINNIFRPIMDGYTDAESLYPGIPYSGPYSFSPETIIIDTDSPEEKAETEEEGEDEVEELKAAELEAREVAKIIQENVGTMFFDTKANKERELEYRDIVILQRSTLSSAQAYSEEFSRAGIPMYIISDEGMFDRIEVHVFLNLLAVINNFYQDIPLLSVLRSEVFHFTTDELAQIRMLCPDEGSFAEVFLAVCGKSSGDLTTTEESRFAVPIPNLAVQPSDELRNHCLRTLEQIKTWKTLSLTMNLPDFLWKVMSDSGYYMISAAMPDGELRQANLRLLVNFARQYSESTQSSMHSFMRYVDTVCRHKVTTPQATLLSETDNVVRMMTIHKSKGLEFPMVIVAGMGKRLMYSNRKDAIIFHKDIGLGLRYVDTEKRVFKPTLPQKLIARYAHEQEAEENLRVLYVAMTRAKDKLYLVGTMKKPDRLLEGQDKRIVSDRSFLDMMEYIPSPTIIRRDELENADEPVPQAIPQPEETVVETVDEPEIDRRLNYVYPFDNAQNTRSKYSVSALNNQAKADARTEHPHGADEPEPAMLTVTRREPAFMGEEKKLTYAERGTVYHTIMEHLDFAKANEDLEEVERCADKLVSSGIITEEEKNIVDLRVIRKFFRTDLGRRCAEASSRKKLWKETTFDLAYDMGGEDTMIQGIVDCFFREDDHIVLVDYKSNWIDLKKPAEEEDMRMMDLYRRQLQLYAKALGQGMNMPVTEAYLYLFAASRCVPLDEWVSE